MYHISEFNQHNNEFKQIYLDEYLYGNYIFTNDVIRKEIVKRMYQEFILHIQGKIKDEWNKRNITLLTERRSCCKLILYLIILFSISIIISTGLALGGIIRGAFQN
jgi:hypothetical protein